MRRKVLFSDSTHPAGVDLLKRRDDFEVDVKPDLSPDALREIIGDYEALVVRSATTVDAQLLANASGLKVIGRAGAGVDNVDVPEATRRGIVVMNTPGGNSVATAEHTVGLIMCLHRHIPQAVASMKEGKWEKKKFQGREMAGRTLGVIGLGRVGGIVARLASQGLKMSVLGYDPVTTAEAVYQMGVRPAPMDEIIATSDVITVHTPLNDQTRGLIGKKQLEAMKSGVMIVNCARGGIIDEDALLEALESGKVAGAALDVYSLKPPGKHPLAAHPRVISTPHLGASTAEAQMNVSIAVAEQIIDFFEKGIVRNAVNVPSLAASEVTRLGPYLDLAGKLGRLLAGLAHDTRPEIEIQYRGEIAGWNIGPITNAALCGFLRRFEGAEVNRVNARMIGTERGLRIFETTFKEGAELGSSISVIAVLRDGTQRAVQGAMIRRMGREPRIIGIDQFITEAVPEGPMLIVTNRDIPGMVAGVAGVLAARGINIAQMNLSRESVGGTALSIINLDEPADDAAMEAIRSIEGILSVTQVILD